MDIDKPIITSDLGRHWASVRVLVRSILERLADVRESGADASCGRGLCDQEFCHEVTSLGTALAAMFAVEESDHFRAQILDENPQLTSRLAALHYEHQHLLAGIDGITELCARRELWGEIESRFESFVKQLTAHEQRETALIQAAAWDDIGVGD